MANPPKAPVRVETLTHNDATRKNIPTAEYQSVLDEQTKTPIQVAYERRNKESLSPHRVLGVDENDELIDPAAQIGETGAGYGGQPRDFVSIILENLRTAGVQQAHKTDKIDFISLVPWPGDLVCAEGRYVESGGADGGQTEKRAAVFIGPEFGTVSRPDLVEAAREAADAGFDVLITCAFNYDAHAGEFANSAASPCSRRA